MSEQIEIQAVQRRKDPTGHQVEKRPLCKHLESWICSVSILCTTCTLKCCKKMQKVVSKSRFLKQYHFNPESCLRLVPSPIHSCVRHGPCSASFSFKTERGSTDPAVLQVTVQWQGEAATRMAGVGRPNSADGVGRGENGRKGNGASAWGDHPSGFEVQ